MILEVKRRVRDKLYGSIDLSPLENKVVEHPFFQRLRRVKQTAFLSYAFPGAQQTRFEHSLGTMHLASRAWQKILANQRRLQSKLNIDASLVDRDGLFNFDMAPLEKNTYCLQALRLAALTHDLGHPPLSHNGEIFLPHAKKFLREAQNISTYLKEYLEQRLEDKKKDFHLRHEVFSVYILDAVLSEIKSTIEPQDIAALLISDIPFVTDSPIENLGLSCVLRELISSDLDVDRMDYLMRDSKECGVVYGIFDADRILDSLSLYRNEKKQTLHLALKLSGLPAFEDYLRARQSMYLQVYFHKVSVAGQAMLSHLSEKIPDLTLPANLNDYCQVDDHNIVLFLQTSLDESTLAAEEKISLRDLIVDLFYNRKLWKSIYEVSSYGKEPKVSREITRLEKYLSEESHKKYRIMLTSNCLTKFRPGEQSDYLKLVHRDHKMRYKISSLDKFSPLSAHNNTVNLMRVYAEGRIKRQEVVELLN